MKKIFFLFLVCIFCIGAFAQNFQWAKTIGSTGLSDEGFAIIVGASGNVYTTGNFQGTVDFDPGPGIYNLTALGIAASGGLDIFILKSDAAGNFLWAKSLGSGSVWGNRGLSIALDLSENIYVTGDFGGTMDFDPGPGVYNLTAANSGNATSDLFILKLDPSGNFLWARATSEAESYANSITIDPLGNCYTTGFFHGTVDFDPGPGIYNMGSPGGYDCYIQKLNASGDFVWAKMLDATGYTIGNSIGLDAAGNIYIGGGFTNTTDFDPGPGIYNLTAAGDYDIFISKFDTLGNLIWAHGMGGPVNDAMYSIAIDAAGNIFTTGFFQEVVDFDPGPATMNLTSAGLQDIFISKFDPSGNLVWAQRIGGIDFDYGSSLVVDALSNIYFTGAFTETVDFDPGPAMLNFTASGLTDVFVSKFDSSGNMLYARQISGTGGEYGYGIAIDALNNTYVTGTYEETIDFDPGIGTYNLSSEGGADIFILKLGPSIVPISLLNFDVTKNKSDAYLTWKTATESNTDKFEIERSDDGISFKKIGEVNASGNAGTIKTYHFIDQNAGMNFPGKIIYYRFKQIDLDGKFTFSPVRSVKFDDGEGFSIYPNPVIDVFTVGVGVAKIGLSYYITDEMGRLILHGDLKNTITVIDMKLLPKGIYFVRVEKEKKAVRLIKQ